MQLTTELWYALRHSLRSCPQRAIIGSVAAETCPLGDIHASERLHTLHGVPANLSLAPFVGASLQRIDLGKWIVYFQFEMQPAGTIGVEGEWELYDAEGVVIDRQQDPAERDSYRLHHLLLHHVVSYKVQAPEWFSLTFDHGMVLKIYDKSRQYESFSIQPGDFYI